MFKEISILLVDDNKDTQEYMSFLLQEECKELILAYDGIEGISKFKKYKPDLIITDLNMPQMNGITMSKKIKKIDFNQPIILLTGYGDLSELQEAINVGLNAFISKPIENIEIVVNAINTVLHNRKKVNGFIPNVNNEDINTIEIINDILQDRNEYIDYPAYIESTN
ncbi:response regulator [Arcobacteraceae bacterium]|nr:response regulator [Arcobacteraceae bacterium]